MSKETIKKEIQRLQRTIERAPRLLKFHGRRVVHSSDWKYGDWSKLPDRYHLIAIWSSKVPEDWKRDYAALLERLKDPALGRLLCSDCAISQAMDVKQEIERHQRYWEKEGGEKARQKHYEELGEPYTSSFLKSDLMRHAKWRTYSEVGGTKERSCNVKNYFHCPYMKKRQKLMDDGEAAYELWKLVEWYDRHWNPSHSTQPTPSEMEWYHFDEPRIIDVTDFDDIMRARSDGRLRKIMREHSRYMKEQEQDRWH